METQLERQFLDHSAEKLEQYTSRIETCLGMLTGEQVWARGGENENAVGNLVLHLSGNVRQWIIASVGGRPDVRDRDSEFDARGGVAIPQLAERLRSTVREAVAVIQNVTHERLSERQVIQQYEVSVLEAIYHVVEHFSMHTGQILFATKMLTGGDLGFYAHLRSTAPHGQKTP
ncbi:MAG TPA: DinB family protein [Bryobacteraceae bacterium]|nr:DinB family protein [Bryobacteraceae bacterium]